MTDEQRQQAIRRIQAKRGFKVHFAVYLAVNAILVVIWAFLSVGFFWPIWSVFGWGIGVAAHAASVYLRPGEITDADIDRELSRSRS